MAWPQDKVDYVALIGGEDLVTPAINVEPGRALLAMNYEPTDKGYRRMDGYERFDGRAAPSSLDLQVDQETQRALIGAVPGSGPIRGVWIYNNVVYAFRDNAGATAGVMWKATTGGWTQVTAATGLAAGGRYEFVNYNFGGHSSTIKMYGVNGVNKAFQFDGTNFALITTGMTTDTPNHVAAHQNYLWLAFPGGSLQNSPLADPTGTWTPITGANEFAMGDDITALVPVQGDILAIFCERSTKLLYGADGSTWQLKTHSASSGAKPYTLQELNGVKGMNAFGMFDMQATQVFGDFEDATFSNDVRLYFERYLSNTQASFTVKEKNQIWQLFNDGWGAIAGFANGRSIGFTRIQLPFDPYCATSGFINSEERIFVGANEGGWVYEFNRGRNFDGANIKSLLKLPYNHFGSPDVRKRIRQVTLMLDSAEGFIIRYQIDFDYGDQQIKNEPAVEKDVMGLGGLWDLDYWNEFVWTGRIVDEPTAKVAGSAKNVSITIVTDSNWITPYTIQGITWRFTPRRLNR